MTYRLSSAQDRDASRAVTITAGNMGFGGARLPLRVVAEVTSGDIGITAHSKVLVLTE